MLAKIASVLLFILLLLLGFRLAADKPLWNDEIYSQLASVENLSPGDILRGRISEGNTCPLFYLTQKMICGIAQYHSPSEWHKGARSWDFGRPVDWIVLRIGPVVAAALAMTAIFYYFARFYSWGTACFSLFLSLSSIMVWHYWAEARPYSLWMLLTTLQVLLFLAIVRVKEYRPRLVNGLAGVQVLLSFTVILSLPQVVLISCLLWFYGVRECKRYVFLLVLPVLIGLTYYAFSPQYPFGLIFSVEQYIRANIARDRLSLTILFAFFELGYTVFHRLRKKNWIEGSILDGLPVLWVLLGMIASACAVLAIFKLKQGTFVQFPVTEKYFIYFTPAGIIAATMFSDRIVRAARSRWWLCSLMALAIAGLTIPRFIKVVSDVLKQYPHFFS